MKKLLKTAFVYAIAAMAAGVFHREFTNFSNFTGRAYTALVHPHLFLLGTVVFMLLFLLEKEYGLTKHKRFNLVYVIYNVGVAITAVAFLTRGIMQVKDSQSSGLSGAVSGVAGVGHILAGAGLILFFLILFSALKGKKDAAEGKKDGGQKLS